MEQDLLDGKQRMTKTYLRQRGGFTLVEIMIVVLIIGVILSIAVPSFIQSRQSARKSSCVGNLKVIETAKEQWAMDNKKNNGDIAAFTDLVGATLYIKSTPSCPTAGTYTINAVGTPPVCNISGHALP
jgi:prepilin-type N-terminal cleavage/methylation domain-containing protein